MPPRTDTDPAIDGQGPPDERGWRAYRPMLLRVYDAWVHGVSNHWLWRCPTRHLVSLYRDHLGPRHLDIGVGTGTLLARALRHHNDTRVTLADANEHCLHWASKRVSRVVQQPPRQRHVDFLTPDSVSPGDEHVNDRFDSVGLVYLLHCLSGEDAKRRALIYAARQLNPAGVCFGATLLGDPPAASRAARWLEHRYQQSGIFSNQSDSRPLVRGWLKESFTSVETWTIGHALLFVARGPVVDQ